MFQRTALGRKLPVPANDQPGRRGSRARFADLPIINDNRPPLWRRRSVRWAALAVLVGAAVYWIYA